MLRQHEGIDEDTCTNAVGSKKGEHNYKLDCDGAVMNKSASLLFAELVKHSKKGRPPVLQQQ